MIVQTTTKATQITVDNTPFFAIIFSGDFDRLKLGNLVFCYFHLSDCSTFLRYMDTSEALTGGVSVSR